MDDFFKKNFLEAGGALTLSGTTRDDYLSPLRRLSGQFGRGSEKINVQNFPEDKILQGSAEFFSGDFPTKISRQFGLLIRHTFSRPLP